MLVERYFFPPFHALLIDVVSLYPQWVPPWSNDRIASLKDCSVPTAWVPMPKRLEWPLPDNVPSVEPDVPATLLDVPYAPQAVELKQRQNRKIGFLIIEEPHDEWNHPWCLVESQIPELLVLCWCSWSVCYDNVLRLASAKATNLSNDCTLRWIQLSKTQKNLAFEMLWCDLTPKPIIDIRSIRQLVVDEERQKTFRRFLRPVLQENL